MENEGGKYGRGKNLLVLTAYNSSLFKVEAWLTKPKKKIYMIVTFISDTKIIRLNFILVQIVHILNRKNIIIIKYIIILTMIIIELIL
jgi:hypothetical protein